MLLAVVVLLAALALGRLGGGSLARLGGLPLDARRLGPIALLVQLGGGLVGGPAYALGLAMSAALLGVFLLRNRDLRGTGLVALGLLSNALVVGLNGAMPVTEAAAARAGIATQDILTGADPRHQPADDSTRLRLLSDVIPVPWPVHPEVVSPGDVLVAAGLGQLVLIGMGASVPTRSRRPVQA